MPKTTSLGGGFPVPDEKINDCDDVKTAVDAYKAEKKHDPNEERYIIDRAVSLGCTEHIPDEWSLV
jgi:hypothetical protein